MCKIKRTVCLLLALVMTSLPLVSCGKPSAGWKGDGSTAVGGGNVGGGDVTDKTGDGLIHGSTTDYTGEFERGGGYLGSYMWGDFVFRNGYMQNDGGYTSYIIFRDTSDPNGEWLPLDCDLLHGEATDKLDADIEAFGLIVDKKLTAENGGVPVFIIAYTVEYTEKNNSHNGRLETKVALFDMKTQKLTVIKDGIDDMRVSTVYLYRDTLYFYTSPIHYAGGDDTFFVNLNKVNTDGSGYSVMDNRDKVAMDIDYIADGAVYYSLDGKIYSSALDFSGLSYLFDAYRVCYADSEYVYYLTAEDLTMTSYDTAFSLCRKSRADISAPAETLLSSDVLTGRTWGSYDFFGGDLYYVTETEGGEALNLYDIKKGESKKIFESEEGAGLAYAASDRVLLVIRKAGYVCVNKETGEVTRFDEWSNL